MNYPEKLIRGIASNDYIDSEGRLSSAAFQFEASRNHEKTDEASITWYDNEEALNIAWNQKSSFREGIQFKAGVAILSRKMLDVVIHRPNVMNALDYERRPTQDNPYHGNLLMKQGLSNGIKRSIIGALAMMSVDEIIRR